MAVIKSFRGVRPKADLVQSIVSPPYDVVSTAEARIILEGNPLSFLRVIKPEVDGPLATDPYSQEIYRRGASNLSAMVREGRFMKDPAPGYYIYELSTGSHVQRGLVCGVSLEEYDRDLVKKHELTMPEKELDRTRHMETMEANTGLVLITYRAQVSINMLVDEICRGKNPVYDFLAPDGVTHRLWLAHGPEEVRQFENRFEEVRELYIADGHHRVAAASRARSRRRADHSGQSSREWEYDPANHFLAALFPHDQLRIFGYNRLIRDLGGLDGQSLLKKISEKFILSETENPSPKGPGHMTMHLKGRWYTLQAIKGTYPEGDPVQSLDVCILQNHLLEPILGIRDLREDRRVDFVSGTGAVDEIERRCSRDMKLAFALYPVSIDQIMHIADRGQTMPPKSTWFEPKLLSGLLVRSWKD